jgi:drug/metabolite transporter (DMT)-like permease
LLKSFDFLILKLMALAGVLYLLLCTLSFSFLDVCRKKLALKYSPYRILTLITGAQIPLYGIWYCFSQSSSVLFDSYALWGIGNIILNLTANLLIVKSLQRSPLSNAIPLLALSPTFSLLFQPLFHIEVHSVQLLGGVVIFAGALILNGLPQLKSKSDQGLLMMFFAAICCGLLILFDRKSLQYAPIPFHGLVQNVGMTALCLVLERIYKIPKREMNMSLERAPWKYWISSSVFAFTAGIGQLNALTYFEPGVVESVKRASVLFISVSFGFFFFRERLSLRKILGVFFMAMGIILSSRH